MPKAKETEDVKKSDEIRKQIDEATDRAEAILNLAKDKDGNERELTADEAKSWKAITDEKDGELAKLQASLKDAIAFEAEVARVRASRIQSNTPAPVYGPNGTPANQVAALPDSVRWVAPKMHAYTWAADREQNIRNAYDSGLWLRALIRRDDRSIRALESRRGDWVATLNENAPADGGYLVVPEFERSVITYREMVGVARRLGRVIPMGSDSYTFFKQSGSTTVYYPGEEGSITASDFDFATVTLETKKRAILSYISAELNDDAVVSVADLLARDMGQQFGLKEDQEAIAGDGTSTYGGVLGLRPAAIAATAGTSQAATGNDTWPELTYADCAKAMALIADKYRGMQLAWLCSQSFKWQVLDRLCLAQGGALASNMVDGVPQTGFAGYPIYTSDRMPTTTAAATVCALFGAFGDCLVIGDRTGLRIATSEHVAFTTDQIAVRGTVRYDIKVHEQGDTVTAGALASLKTAA